MEAVNSNVNLGQDMVVKKTKVNSDNTMFQASLAERKDEYKTTNPV